jgi:hypothetical protein
MSCSFLLKTQLLVLSVHATELVAATLKGRYSIGLDTLFITRIATPLSPGNATVP